MAVEYKKLIFRHIDKLIFVAFLSLFVVVGLRFVMSGPPPRVSVAPMPNRDFRVPEELYKERFVLNALKNPGMLDATHDFTTDPGKIEPGDGEKTCPECGWFVQQDLPQCPHCGYAWEVTPPPPPPPAPGGEKGGIPFRVVEIGRKPVDILFMGFAKNPWTNWLDLQINWGGGETTFVPLGETFRGYRLYPLEERVVKIRDPGGATREEEQYFLTIKKPGEAPLVVGRGKTVRENEAFAILDAGGSRWKITHRAKHVAYGVGRFEVYGGYVLEEIGGKGGKYEVAIVRDTQVVVRNGQGEEAVLPVS